jgi:hypothetical protein
MLSFFEASKGFLKKVDMHIIRKVLHKLDDKKKISPDELANCMSA